MVTIKIKIYPKVKHKDRNPIAEIKCILLTKSNLRQTEQPRPCKAYTNFEKVRTIKNCMGCLGKS